MHWFWALSAGGFLYLMLDESFQFHEGMDSGVARLFGVTTDPKLDGAATLAYGVAVAAFCYWFRSEIFRYRQTVWLFAVGGFFLVVTSLLNAGRGDTGQDRARGVGKAARGCFVLPRSSRSVRGCAGGGAAGAAGGSMRA
jgi:hypothetical protein